MPPRVAPHRGVRRDARRAFRITRIVGAGMVLAVAWHAAAQPAAEAPTPTPAPADEGDPVGGAPSAIVELIPGTGVEITLAPIPAGTLERPDPDNPDAVATIDIPAFYMSTTEITWDAYDIFVFALDQPDPSRPADADVVARPSKPYLPPDRGFGHAGYPALSMTHHAAERFCAWLSARTGRRYRLATEAEWEHACRAGSAGAFSFIGAMDSGSAALEPAGSAVPPDVARSLADHAWFADNAEFTTHPVATLEPNAFGLYDMHGNAAEWVVGHDGEPVVCGGSYLDPAEGVAATSRQKQTRAWQASDPQIPRSRWWLSDATHVGFRIVCEME